jgi:hypothetical protein
MGRVLSAEHLLRYNQQGFVFPFQILSSSEVSLYCDLIASLLATLDDEHHKLTLRQPHLHFRWAYDLATDPRILDLVQDIIGPNIIVHTSSIFRKSGNDITWVPWHQDGHYWGLSRPSLVSAWIALTESNVENGCVRVIPGSHDRRLPHRTVPTPDSMLASGLRLEVEPDGSNVVNVSLSPGAISLHHVNLVHGSGQNHSDKPRIGFAVRYVVPEVSQTLEHHRVVLARGRDDYHNYRLLDAPPTANIDDGIESLREINEWAKRVRFAAGS